MHSSRSTEDHLGNRQNAEASFLTAVALSSSRSFKADTRDQAGRKVWGTRVERGLARMLRAAVPQARKCCTSEQ